MAHSIAIIVPYTSSRAEHLKALVPILLNWEQGHEPWVIVVEQTQSELKPDDDRDTPFNRGLLCNLGARIAMEEEPGALLCFHDVDMHPRLVPEEESEEYTQAVYAAFPGEPMAMIGHVEKREKWQAMAHGYFGGACVFGQDDFMKCGGFSNQFWGWGPEDMELRMRCEWRGLKIRYQGADYIHQDHPHESLREDLNANCLRLGQTQDKKIKPEEDGILTLPAVGHSERTDADGGTAERPTKVTRITYPIYRPQFEKMVEKLRK